MQILIHKKTKPHHNDCALVVEREPIDVYEHAALHIAHCLTVVEKQMNVEVQLIAELALVFVAAVEAVGGDADLVQFHLET
jgi:hypothetical protein